MYFAYSVLLLFAAIAGIPYWCYRIATTPKFRRNLRQRLGFNLPVFRIQKDPIWLHAVSVGEVLAAKSLVFALRSCYPNIPIVVSTVTLTGQALALREFAGVAEICYFPLDFSFSINRFLARLHPRAVLLMETELWPNFVRICAGRPVPIFLINGRISDPSFRNYQFMKKLARSMLQKISAIGTQTEADQARFIHLGAEKDRVQVTGNLKFDFPIPDLDPDCEWLSWIRASLGAGGAESTKHIIVIGSTMKGEESLMMETFQRVRAAVPQARMILAPRHPERFDEVAAMLEKSQSTFQRRSRLCAVSPKADIILLDSMGELRNVYSLATIAVIGGSFLPFGGHNPLEPAALGRAIVHGPEMGNFREIADIFCRAQAARCCPLNGLAETLITLLKNVEEREELGRHAYDTYKANQGATDSTLNLLKPYLA